MIAFLIPTLALVPGLIFLTGLALLDSYKLTRLRVVLAVVLAGAACAMAAWVLNGALRHGLGLDGLRYGRWVAPFVEESLKAIVVVALLRMNRLGFLVDAAILGFAAGLGFALVENTWYMVAAPHAPLGTWIVRGLGTALMHGAVTAIFAVLLLEVVDTRPRQRVLAFAGCLLAAILLHMVFNQFWLSPLGSTVVVILVLPTLLHEVFRAGQHRLSHWLGSGFDADAQMLELLGSGQLGDSPLGQYLGALRDRFEGLVVADILSYIRVYTELALRAKGLLMARESGLELPFDEETRARFTELDYLERSIGRTGLLAIRPMLHMGRTDLWQLNMLDGAQASGGARPATA